MNFKVVGFSKEVKSEQDFDTQKEAIAWARSLIDEHQFFKVQVFDMPYPTPRLTFTQELSRG